MRPPVDWFALSPELVLLGASGLGLMAAVVGPRWLRMPLAGLLSTVGFAGALGMAAALSARSADGHGVIADAIRRDRWSALAMCVVCGVGLLAALVSWGERRGRDHGPEYYALLAACGAGMLFLTQANNLITLFLGLEWFSLCLYILCAIDLEREESLEAGLKYLVVGSFGSAVLLFGSALVYGSTGKVEFGEIAGAISAQGLRNDVLVLLGLAMIMTGLGFKASAAPFHMWTPDVYEGAPTAVTAFMAAATKVVALTLALRVLTTAFPAERGLWTAGMAALACASLAIGNLAALVQRNVKRMLAYSSISHAGFMLIAVSADTPLGGRALMYYFIPYSATSLGAFAVVAARERELARAVTLDNLAGLGWERPVLGGALWVFMLGMAGLPLTGGFVGKFYVFSAAYDRGWTWLLIVGIVATIVSLYYYLAVIRALYMRPSAELGLAAAAGGSPPPERLLSAAVVACLVVTVGSFFAVQPLIDLARDAAASIPL
jgi:NADH-quinone oxidoreductase subunit N